MEKRGGKYLFVCIVEFPFSEELVFYFSIALALSTVETLNLQDLIASEVALWLWSPVLFSASRENIASLASQSIF